jgi:hypothetical protein
MGLLGMSDYERAFNITAEPTYIMQYDPQDRLSLTILRRECLHDRQKVIRNAGKVGKQ